MSKVKEKKSEELDFSIGKTLMVIQKDTMLSTMLAEKFSTNPVMMITLNKNDSLSQESKDYVREIFDKVITQRKEYIKLYNELKDEPKLPKWYGKEKILSDLKEKGGRPTELQRAMLALNKIKNIYSRLNARCIKDLHGEEQTLSTKDCREIMAIAELVEKRAENIFGKKIK